MRIQKNNKGVVADLRTNRVVTQPQEVLTSEMETVIINPSVIVASAASQASLASVASPASFGSVASAASVASRASIASLSSSGSISSSASIGSVASVASYAYRPSYASQASSGTAGGFDRRSRASYAAKASYAGPIQIELPAVSAAENINICFRGSSGRAYYYDPAAALINGQTRRDIATEHQIDFLVPGEGEWSVKS